MVVQLYNLQGQLVHRQAVPADLSQPRFTLNTNSLPVGVYLVRVNGGNQAATRKVLILK
jgi:hypothetical protein